MNFYNNFKVHRIMGMKYYTTNYISYIIHISDALGKQYKSPGHVVTNIVAT